MTFAIPDDVKIPPTIQKLRLDTVRRKLTVAEKMYVSPNMIRLTLSGDELEGFWSPGFDDNIKVFVPDQNGATVMRSYTPRHYDAVSKELVVDFAVHEAGPATRWALDVEPGETAEIGGPRGSKLIEGKIDRWLMIADETAIPALARRLEQGQVSEEFYCVISVPRPEDEQVVSTKATVRARWLHREPSYWEANDPTPILDVLARHTIPPGTFIWIAAEGGVVRKVRDYLMRSRGIAPEWIRATGYWVAGNADASAKFD